MYINLCIITYLYNVACQLVLANLAPLAAFLIFTLFPQKHQIYSDFTDKERSKRGNRQFQKILIMASFGGTTQKCKACEKTVYLVDELTTDGKVYHKSCFRCHHCRGTLKVVPCFFISVWSPFNQFDSLSFSLLERWDISGFAFGDVFLSWVSNKFRFMGC